LCLLKKELIEVLLVIPHMSADADKFMIKINLAYKNICNLEKMNIVPSSI
jgi:hypothetical protein